VPDHDPDLDDPDALYALDPAAFTAARTALARRLKAEGRKDEAAAVAKLRRPSALAHALNRVARESPDVIGAALEAGARLRDATDEAIAGDAGSLRAATADEREAAAAVVRAAGPLPGGDAATAAARIGATLRAAIVDEDVADRLRRGVLTTDLAAPGFGGDLGGLGGLTAAGGGTTTPPTRLRPRSRPDAPTDEPTPAPDRRGRATRRSAGEGSPPVDLAERRRAKAEAQAAQRAEEEAAAEAARQARRRRQEAEADVRRLEKRADRLAAAAERVEAEAAEARATATEAAEEADRARDALDDLE
jgi:hypothetical protein